MTSQFEFLKQPFPLLFDLCHRAETYCHTDPSASANNSRKALEAGLRIMFDPDSTPGHHKKISDYLECEEFTARAPTGMRRRAWEIVRIGNRGSHADHRPPTKSDALDALDSLFEFAKWLVASVVNLEVDHLRFTRKAVRPGDDRRRNPATTAEILASAGISRSDIAVVMRLDNYEFPTDPLSERAANLLRRYVDLSKRLPVTVPDGELTADEHALLEAVATTRPTERHVLAAGSLITPRLQNAFELARHSNYSTANRFRLRHRLLVDDVDVLRSELPQHFQTPDPIVAGVARAWCAGFDGDTQADWALLLEFDTNSVNRLIEELGSLRRLTALAEVPAHLAHPKSGALSLTACFDVACARLATTQSVTESDLFDFFDMWTDIEAGIPGGRVSLLSRPSLGILEARLTSPSFLMDTARTKAVWHQLSAMWSELAPGSDTARLLNGTAGAVWALVDGTHGDSTSVRRHFLQRLDLPFIDTEVLHEAARAVQAARGMPSNLSVLDLADVPGVTELVYARRDELDPNHRWEHQLLLRRLVSTKWEQAAQSAEQLLTDFAEVAGVSWKELRSHD